MSEQNGIVHHPKKEFEMSEQNGIVYHPKKEFEMSEQNGIVHHPKKEFEMSEQNGIVYHPEKKNIPFTTWVKNRCVQFSDLFWDLCLRRPAKDFVTPKIRKSATLSVTEKRLRKSAKLSATQKRYLSLFYLKELKESATAMIFFCMGSISGGLGVIATGELTEAYKDMKKQVMGKDTEKNPYYQGSLKGTLGEHSQKKSEVTPSVEKEATVSVEKKTMSSAEKSDTTQKVPLSHIKTGGRE